ncbi:MAG TPA: hypothetical protein VN131_02035 [Mobilitalea sp.]|nr:hypothetical protein [Mobilitalea sp.]
MELNLKDASLTINGLVSYCKCKCKHCLLCSGDNKTNQISFDRLEQLALKFEGFRNVTGINTSLCVYNCADYPELPRAMEVDRKISEYTGYQNLNGTPIRSSIDLSEWVTYLKIECGVTNANLTWFGNEEYHDTFVQREGYYQYLIELAAELRKQKMNYHNTVFVLHSNLAMLEKLYNTLNQFGGTISFSILDYRGNAKKLIDEFLTQEDIKKMPDFLFHNNIYNANRYKLQTDWATLIKKGQAPDLTSRLMFLVATPDNIDSYMQMTCDEIIEMFHEIDKKLQQSLPSILELANRYGNEDNILIDYRSLIWKWIDRWFDDNLLLDRSILFSDLHTSVMWR